MGILSRIRKKFESPPSVNRAVAMILLPSTDAMAFDRALQHLASHWQDVPRILDIETTQDRATAKIPGGTLGVIHLPIPMPADELDGPATLAWHWPSAREQVAVHKSHVLVHVASSALDMVDVRLLHTKLVASILATADTVGVYIGKAFLIRSSPDYMAQAASASRDNLPILLWIGINGVNETSAVSAYTTGLTAFGLHELEIRESSANISEVYGELADLANYQLSSGQRLNDGDTFGQTVFDRRRVRYGQSRFIPDMTVAVIEAR